MQALLQDNAPWWLLTHYPAANDVFSWLDGLCILIFLLGGGAAVGLALLATVRLGAWVANHPGLSWQRLSLSLVPLAGAGLFLGLSMLTLAHLKAERIPLEWVPPVRIALLAAGSGFSAYLLWKLTAIGVPLRRAFSARPYTPGGGPLQVLVLGGHLADRFFPLLGLRRQRQRGQNR